MKNILLHRHEADYRVLNELWNDFQRLRYTDFPRAREFFACFQFGLQRHLLWEVEDLFPSLQRSFASSLREDHTDLEMLGEELFAKMRRGANRPSGEDSFYNLFQQHQRKESTYLSQAMTSCRTVRDNMTVASLP